MKKKISFLCLLLALIIPFTALAGVRMPVQRGAVTDDANVLGKQITADLTEYAKLLSEETDVELHVAFVHFLDGLDAQSYAAQLFENWDLGKDAVLLLVAAGEDSFATAMGQDAAEALGKANAENLMYTSSGFSGLIRAQQYDAAMSDYAVAFNELVEKQTGETIRMSGLFGAQESVSANVQNYGSQLWMDMMDAIEDTGVHYQQRYEQHEQQDNGLTAGGWIVLLVLVWIVIRQSRPLKHAPHRRQRRRSGCGCSPLGWILGLLGLGILFDKD